MTKEQAYEFVRVAMASPEERDKMNVPPAQYLTRADIERLKSFLVKK